jgi:REP element-mobilizing transposase RayT
MAVTKQLGFFAHAQRAYGGTLMKTRKGRAKGGRPIVTRHSMHLVLRSTKATGKMSFRYLDNPALIRRLIKKYSERFHVRILSAANVGNHLHLHIKIKQRQSYAGFIRALTGAIAMAISGRHRWSEAKEKLKFWDYRPFTRVVEHYRAYLQLKDYIKINMFEGLGVSRIEARFLVRSGVG